MSLPEKLAIFLVIIFVAVIGYFLIAMLMSDKVVEPTNIPSPDIEEKNGEKPALIESDIIDDDGISDNGEDGNVREEIKPVRESIDGLRWGVAAGRPVDEKGIPIEGVAVMLYRGGHPFLTHIPAQEKLDIEDLTDKSGAFELVGIESGEEYMIVALHPEYADTSVSPVKVTSGKRVELADIVMGHGMLVGGTVKNHMETPVSGALVRISDPIRSAFIDEEERKPWKQVFTDDNGAYSFENVSFKTMEITASAEGFATQRKTNNVQLDQRDASIVDFILGPGTSVSGRVLDTTGVPMEGVKVEATMVRNKKFSSTAVDFTGQDGSFSLDGLYEGVYLVRASIAGFSDCVKQAVESGTTDLVLQLKPRGGISGVVRDYDSNRPVTEFRIRAMNSIKGRPPRPAGAHESYKSKDGSYRLSDLEPGHYSFVVSSDGYADTSSDEVTVVRDYVIPNVDIYMNHGGELSGRVVSAKGEPIKGVKVCLNENNYQDNPLFKLFDSMAGSGGKGKKKRAITGEDGKFHMDLLIPGVYQVAFSHDEYSDKAINDIEVVLGKGATPSMGDVFMTQGARVHGTLYDASGKPVPGTKVVITTTGKSGFMDQTNTDKSGNYSFGHMRPGEYMLSVQVSRLGGKQIKNIFKQLIIAKNSRVTVYLEEGKDIKTDMHISE